MTKSTDNETTNRPSGEVPSSVNANMERELHKLLGAMLGMLEVLASDLRHPLSERQRAWVAEAVRYGHMLKDRVDAVLLLANHGAAEERLRPAPVSLRRLVEHAVRGAAWEAEERKVRLILPSDDASFADTIVVDVQLVDRAVRSMTETLILLIAPGELEATVVHESDFVHIELRGQRDLGVTPAVFEDERASELLCAAWQRVAELHRGSLLLDLSAGRIRLSLPARSS
jgi:hypothetical protein